MLPSAESVQIVLPVASFLFLGLAFWRSIFGVVAYFIVLNGKLGEMYPALGAMRFELVVAVVALGAIPIGKGSFRWALPKANPLNRYLWAFFVVGMVSVVQSVDFSTSWALGGYFLLKLTILYVMVTSSVRTQRDLNVLLWAVVGMTAWIAYEPVVNYFQGVVNVQGYGDVAYGRFGAAAGHVGLANTLCQSIPLTWFFLRAQPRGLKKVAAGGCLAIMVVGVILTKSRGGFIGLAAGVFVIAWFSRQRGRAIMLSTCFLLAVVLFSGDQYVGHLETIADGAYASRSSSDRVIGLLNGISMMIKRPLFGVGLGAYPAARYKYFNYYFYAHNLYGELFGELGLASAVWFYWIYQVFRHAGNLRQRDAEGRDLGWLSGVMAGVQGGLFVRLVIGNFSHCARIWFWFLMAALVVVSEDLMERADTGAMEPASCPKELTCFDEGATGRSRKESPSLSWRNMS